MTNPFKKSYRIEEFKNQNGETKFVATYCSPLARLFMFLDDYPYLDEDGDRNDTPQNGRYDSLALAQDAIQKSKDKAVEELKSAYKKSAIHYVE
jgi:hypothetical protein